MLPITTQCVDTDSKNLRLRERTGGEGEFEVCIYGAFVGYLNVSVKYDGGHVTNSPALLECAPSHVAPGRCYACGPGLTSPLPLGVTARLTVVACDASGTRRKGGGEDFTVLISPKLTAHHL